MNLAANLWFFLALGSAIFWGLGYTYVDRILKGGLNPFLLLTFMVIPQAIAYFIFFIAGRSDLKAQFRLIQDPAMSGALAIVVATFIAGNAFIFSSIQMKNASLANIIEISYPIFVVFFSWLIFKESGVNLYTFLGGLLIFSGVTLILLKS